MSVSTSLTLARISLARAVQVNGFAVEFRCSMQSRIFLISALTELKVSEFKRSVHRRFGFGQIAGFGVRFCGSFPAEDFAGSAVQFSGDRVEFGLTVVGEVGRFREVLAEKSVSVFVRRPQPG